MSRRSRIRGRRSPLEDSAQYIKILCVLITILVLSGMGAVFHYGDTRQKEENSFDPVTMCPKTGPETETAILLDRTDSYSDIQRLAIEKEILTWARKVPVKGALKIYEVGQGGTLLEPLVDVCNPGEGSDTVNLASNGRMQKKKYQERYEGPVNALIKEMANDKTADRSLLMEAIQSIAVRDSYGDSLGIPHKLIIISDLLQYNPENSALNFYKPLNSFEDFKNLPEAKTLRADLSGTEVELRLLYRAQTDGFQNGELINFWNAWLQDLGVEKINYEPIPG